MKHRLPALDWMRGIVMVLMASDHASEAFNAARPAADSSLFPGWDQPLDPGQFLFRWLSHLCAPVFLFLAGTSLALSVERKRERGATAASIDRDLLVRGLLVLSVDLFFINWLWQPGIFVLQVMFAIGMSMILMIALRRLPTALLLVLSLLALVACEWTRTGYIGMPLEATGQVVQAFLFNLGYIPAEILRMNAIIVAYPIVPWCAMMAMGWALGRFLLARRDRDDGHAATMRLLTWSGIAAVAIFVVLRWRNGFGNLELPRLDDSLVQWLHVSKYPPSLTFTALELGIMCLLLAGLFRLEVVRGVEPDRRNPILVFGQTAFFFYVAHILFLEVAARLTGKLHDGDLGDALVALALVLVVLYPLCVGYRRLKAARPHSLLRYF